MCLYSTEMLTVLLTLRVWAVYGQDRRIGFILFSVFIGCWTTAFVWAGLSIQQLTKNGDHYCPLFLISYLILCTAGLLQSEAFHNTCSFVEPNRPVIVAGALVILYDSSPSVVSLNCKILADRKMK
jgi:hypothetical protein